LGRKASLNYLEGALREKARKKNTLAAALGEVFYYLFSCRSLKINDKAMATISAG